MSKKILSALALIAFFAPCTIFAAGKSTQKSLADFDRAMSVQRSQGSDIYAQPQHRTRQEPRWERDYDYDRDYDYNRYYGDDESVRVSLGAEAFYGHARRDLISEESSPDGIDLYGANLKIGVATPALSGVKKIVPEFFVLGGFGYGEDTLYEENYIDEYESGSHKTTETGYYKTTGTSMMYHVSAGATLNFEITKAFSISASGRLGICSSKFKVDAELDYTLSENGETKSGHREAKISDDSDAGLIYGVGVGAHWTIANHHKISIGVELAHSNACPKVEDEDGDIKLNKQDYVFFSAGYRFVF